MRARLVFLWVSIGALLAGTIAIIDIAPTEVLAIASPTSDETAAEPAAEPAATPQVTTRAVTLTTTGCTDYAGNVTECPPEPVDHCLNGVLTTTLSDALPNPITFPGDPATLDDGTPGTLGPDCTFTPDPILVTYCTAINGTLTTGTETEAGTSPRPGDPIFLTDGTPGTLGPDCEFIPDIQYCDGTTLVTVPENQLPANALQPGDTVTINGETGILGNDCGFQQTVTYCPAIGGTPTTVLADQLPADAIIPGITAVRSFGQTGFLGTVGADCVFIRGDLNGNGVLDINEDNICIFQMSEITLQNGTSTCGGSDDADSAIATGDGATAYAYGTNAIATANGKNAEANATGDNADANATGADASATAFGDNAEANAFGTNAEADADGADATANADGDNAEADAFGTNAEAIADGDNAEAIADGDCSASAIGNGAFDSCTGP